MKYERITRRIGTDSIELIDGKGYATLSQSDERKLLIERLSECEDRIEKEDLMRSYFALEDFLYIHGKDKSIEIKSAMVWGALLVLSKNGSIDWETQRSLFGEFMSKQLNLR